MALADALERAGDRVVVAELRGGVSVPDAVLPYQCELLGQELGYAAALTWSPTLAWWMSSTPVWARLLTARRWRCCPMCIGRPRGWFARRVCQ